MSHPSVLDWDTAGARCRRQKARTPAAPQLTRSQSSTKQTPDRLSPQSRSWHPATVWKCWAVVIRAPPGGTRGGCPQTTAGSQMLMVGRLLLAHQAWAHQEDIRGGKACQVALPPPALTGITFGARTSSLMITESSRGKGFSAPLARFAGLVVRAAWPSYAARRSFSAGVIRILRSETILLSPDSFSSSNCWRDKCSIILDPTALKHDEVGQLSIGSTDQSRGW